MTRQPAPAELPDWPAAMPVGLAARYVGLAAATLRREAKEGRAPAPIKLTRRRLAWSRAALDRWLAEKEGRPQDIPNPADPNAAAASWDEALDGHG